MFISTLRSVGGSVMLAIPKPIIEELGLAANTRVALSVVQGRLVVEVRPKLKCTLVELLAQCDPTGPENHEDPAWQDMGPVGREVW